MITASQIANTYDQASDPDFEMTQALKLKLANARANRQPFYLKLDEFIEILSWKLGKQYNRGEAYREENTEEIVYIVTQASFAITHSDLDYETDLKVGILCTLRGVGVPIASAILALTFPEKYAVLDFRVWRQIFDKQQENFSITDYKAYLKKIQELSAELDWLPQVVDRAIWLYDYNKPS